MANILLVGANQGIGYYLTERLLALGNSVAVLDISTEAIESLAKCLEIENMEYGISFHLFHPPLTDTKSAAGLPIPKEFKADAKKVGYGLANNIWSKKFVICHSLSQAVQMKFSYRHPLFIGKLMTKMTKRAIDGKE